MRVQWIVNVIVISIRLFLEVECVVLAEALVKLDSFAVMFDAFVILVVLVELDVFRFVVLVWFEVLA